MTAPAISFVRISPETLRELQARSTASGMDVNDLLMAALSAYDQSSDKAVAPTANRDPMPRTATVSRPYDDENALNLTGAPDRAFSHTDITSFMVNGEDTGVRSWAGVMQHMIGMVSRSHPGHKLTGERLVSILRRAGGPLRVIPGCARVSGFKPIPDLDISMQAMIAGRAWAGACIIAESLGVALDVRLLWRSDAESKWAGKSGYARCVVASGGHKVNGGNAA